ncbi:MAG TPA: FmdB family zinc ribbon protein [Candidatus Binatia bacterium]|nr:FmdB family zinc ribbon protein [Candidatus Binatia bacterium]
MPLYEYQCKQCHSLTERIQKFSDPPLTTCPHCGGELEQLLSAPAVQFKGSGWYVTDYARKSGKPASSGNGSGAASAEAKPDAPKSSSSSGSEKGSSSSDRPAGRK